MIAKLTGLVDSVAEDHLVLDVGGVGYLVYCSGRTLQAVATPGARFSLDIETHVRQDHIHLYGFAAASERDWFRMLTTVQGVGARVALAILTVLGADELADAVMAQDRAALSRAAGVGPKLATRILTELKDRVGDLMVVRGVDFGAGAAAAGSGPVGDAISALVNLGYRRGEAYGAVSQAARQLGEDARIEALIKAGLKELGA